MTTNLRSSLDSYRARPGEVRLIDVPPMRYLMVDGHGDPNTAPEYADALAMLYPVAYALKYASKADGTDYVVPPLEALWWAQDMAVFTVGRDKAAWDWTLMLVIPDWLTAEHVAAARGAVAARKPALRVERVRDEVLDEGLCVQTLHVGSYDDEGPVLADLHRSIAEQGLQLTGKHHEIYLGDPRRTAPEKLRTILRQPVRRRQPPAPGDLPA